MVLVRELVSGIKDMVASGRLSETDIPDDFQWLLEKLERLDETKSGDDELAVTLAQRKYCNDDIEVDPDCFMSVGDQGRWVSAWLWVYDHELEELKEDDAA